MATEYPYSSFAAPSEATSFTISAMSASVRPLRKYDLFSTRMVCEAVGVVMLSRRAGGGGLTLPRYSPDEHCPRRGIYMNTNVTNNGKHGDAHMVHCDEAVQRVNQNTIQNDIVKIAGLVG